MAGRSKNKSTKKNKRAPSEWNNFVKSVQKDNPDKSFKEVLVLASKLKKQGKMGKATTSKKAPAKKGKGKKTKSS